MSQDDETSPSPAASVEELRVELARRTDEFAAALRSRDTIGQAKGVLMERYGLDSEASFALLQRYSRTSNRPLRQLAEELLETRRLPPLSPAARPSASC